MKEIMTIEGLRTLFMKRVMFLNGNKKTDVCPEEIKMAEKYMKLKEVEFEKHRRCCSDCLVKQQYNEAKNIITFLRGD